MKFKRFSTFCFILLLIASLMAITLPGWAQDIRFEVSVDQRSVSLDTTLELSATIYGHQQAPMLALPDIEGFRSQYLGPSTNVSIINGVYSSSVAYRYLLFPQQVGTFKIPSLTIDIQGQTYSSEPISVEVVSSRDQVKTPKSYSGSVPQGATDKVFMTMQADKQDVFFNEPVQVVIKLFVAQTALSDINFPQIESKGFLVEDGAAPSQYRELKDGIYYDVVEFRINVYPTEEGLLTLGPAKIDAHLLYRRPSQRRTVFDEFDFFKGGFFDEVFSRYEKYPITLKSDPVAINVRPLPEPQVKDFSLAVGQFDIDVSVSPREVSVGDPITVRMTLSGVGNLRNVRMPRFAEDDSFRVYDPQIREEDGVKTLEQVLIPIKQDISQVPSVRFTYFDIYRKDYQTITRGPFDITVKPSREEKPLRVVEMPRDQRGAVLEDPLGRDIIYIKEDPGRIAMSKKALYQNIIFWIIVVFYTFGLAVFFIFYHQQQRAKTDVAYAKRLKAPSKARQGLKQIRQRMGLGQEQQFYDELFNFLKEYLHHRLAIPEGSVTPGEIEDFLRRKGVSAVALEKTHQIFLRCESIRYGAWKADLKDVQNDYKDLREIVDAIERLDV